MNYVNMLPSVFNINNLIVKVFSIQGNFVSFSGEKILLPMLQCSYMYIVVRTSFESLRIVFLAKFILCLR